ncbi:type II toxin-antitoxin system YoeB family toxin [Escherichia coli]|uniref:type II toxin-antitoxin system YoeB family toxin n=1 Tax=Escherichia coli TaxID=562 RepID=UPI000BDE5D42|nr:type II toxin-antitoxin system YoeB family toxin [Escherichia coli]
MKYKRRSTGEEKVQKIAAGEEGNYRMERVPLKQTDRHHKSPGGDLCIRDRRITEEHRLVYAVTDDSLLIAACRYHY